MNTTVQRDETIVVIGSERYGQTGTIIEVLMVEHSTLPSHLVKFRTKEVWLQECNIHPVCRYHARREARFKSTSKNEDQYSHAYFCGVCAENMDYSFGGQSMEEMHRYEPMSEAQLVAANAHRRYADQLENLHYQDDTLPCVVCCSQCLVSALSEDKGVCPNCIAHKRRVPGWLYPFSQFGGAS